MGARHQCVDVRDECSRGASSGECGSVDVRELARCLALASCIRLSDRALSHAEKLNLVPRYIMAAVLALPLLGQIQQCPRLAHEICDPHVPLAEPLDPPFDLSYLHCTTTASHIHLLVPADATKHSSVATAHVPCPLLVTYSLPSIYPWIRPPTQTHTLPSVIMAEVAAGLWAAEEVVSTGVQVGIAAYMVSQPTMPLKGTFRQIATAPDDNTR